LFAFEKYRTIDNDVNLAESAQPMEENPPLSSRDLDDPTADLTNFILNKTNANSKPLKKTQSARDRFLPLNLEQWRAANTIGDQEKHERTVDDDVVSLVSHISRKYNLPQKKGQTTAQEDSDRLRYHPLVFPSQSSVETNKQATWTPTKRRSIAQFEDSGQKVNTASLTSIIPKHTELFKNLKAELDDLLHNVNFKKISKFK
jgi:hypothetical protein